MTTTALALPTTEKLETDASEILELAQATQITSIEQQQAAAGVLQDIKKLKAEVNDTFDPVCDSAHKAWKAAVAARTKHLEPLEKAERLIKDKTGAFVQQQEQARLATLRAAQEKAEAEERARRAAEAEEQRKANEAAAKAAAAKAAELKKAGDIAAAKRLKEEEAKRQAEAERIAAERAAAPVCVAVEAPPPVQKVAGQTTTTVYDFEIVDKAKIPLQFLIPDEVAIRKTVKALKDQAAGVIPGIRIITKTQIGTR